MLPSNNFWGYRKLNLHLCKLLYSNSLLREITLRHSYFKREMPKHFFCVSEYCYDSQVPRI